MAEGGKIIDVEATEVPAVKPHIFVATPMYGGMCTGYFTNSLIAMTNVMKNLSLIHISEPTRPY